MPKFKALPPLEELREAFEYDSTTGLFFHKKKNASCVEVGDPAGSKTSKGYVCLSLKKRTLLAHRVAWFLHTGQDPLDKQVDHKDRNKVNNAIQNLRLATSEENHLNNAAKGYIFEPGRGMYRAQIQQGKKKIHLGRFFSAEEAEAAYRAKARELRGEFARQA